MKSHKGNSVLLLFIPELLFLFFFFFYLALNLFRVVLQERNQERRTGCPGNVNRAVALRHLEHCRAVSILESGDFGSPTRLMRLQTHSTKCQFSKHS